jgi:hypothetical protein
MFALLVESHLITMVTHPTKFLERELSFARRMSRPQAPKSHGVDEKSVHGNHGKIWKAQNLGKSSEHSTD